MKLIGIHGRYHSGKDEAFSFIDHELSSRGMLALRKAFADALKISGMRTLGLGDVFETPAQLIDLANVIKETGRVTVSWQEGDHLQAVAITGRELWQLYGTEAHRADDLGHSFHPNFWVDNLLPLDPLEGKYDVGPALKVPLWYHSFQHEFAGYADVAVVPDVRFPNEATRIHELGGEVWWIDAEERLGPATDAHSSEVRLDQDQIDRIVDNNGTLDGFEENVLTALYKMGI